MKRLFIIFMLIATPCYATNWCEDTDVESCWTLEDGSGTATDESSNSNDGTLVNATWASSSTPGSFSTYYVDFDGTGDYIDVGTMGNFGSNLDSNTTSFVFWFKTSTTTLMAVMGQGNNTGDDTVLLLEINKDPADLGTDTGAMWQRIRDENNYAQQGGVVSDLGFTDGTWHHWVSIYSVSGDGNCYLDGVLKTWTDTNGYAPTTLTNTANFTGVMTLGALNWKDTIGADGYFNGSMDDIAFFNKALDGTDINDIYENGLVQASANSYIIFR